MWTPSSKKQKLRLVLDTNVWISAMIWGGSPARIIKAAEEGKVCIITSKEIVSEISRTVMYPRVKRSYEDKGISKQEITAAVLRLSTLIEVKSKIHAVREDPADDKFLECAVDSKADYIVSGDDNLLKIGTYKKTRIFSVKQVLKILEK